VMHGASNIKQFEDLIMDELNVKSVVYLEEVEEYADYKLSINFPVLGKRLPAKMKDIIAASKKGEWSVVSRGRSAAETRGPQTSHEARGSSPRETIGVAGETLLPEEFTLNLVPKTTKGTKALSGNDGVIILNLEIDRALELEGLARDIIRSIQQARKEADFHISDHIKVECSASGDVAEALRAHEAMIGAQTLSEFAAVQNPAYQTDAEIGNDKIIIKFIRK